VAEGASDTFDPAAGTMWDEMETAWTAAKRAMVRDLGLIPDVVGCIYLLGDNDSRTAATATAFATKLSLFNESVRERFTTRSTGDELPIVCHQPPQHIDNGGRSVIGIVDVANRCSAAMEIPGLEMTCGRGGGFDEDSVARLDAPDREALFGAIDRKFPLPVVREDVQHKNFI
jgi:hypothetical protein